MKVNDMKSVKRLIKQILPPPIVDFVQNRIVRKAVVDGIKKALDDLQSEAEEKFSSDACSKGTLQDYLLALKKHWVSYSEYMYQYEFYNLNEAERSEYISRLQMIAFYRLVLPSRVKNIFWNKKMFLNRFAQYIHRQWLDVNKCTYDEFVDFISEKDCIVKLGEGCCGQGVFKTYTNVKEYTQQFYEVLKQQDALVEECIEGCAELQSFHHESLNTIRVVTILHEGRHQVLHAFFRTGTGKSVVDNAHAGGLFAQINVENGIIESNGISVNGDNYTKHPDTGVQFMGFIIPRWAEIKSTVISAAETLPGLFICGWDVTITNDGLIEIIEGNHGPDFDVMQSPLKKGYFHRINQDIKSFYKKDILELIRLD